MKKPPPPRKPVPFLKWAGGKTQILDVIDMNLPKEYKGYAEPFLGGGALFFYLSRTKQLSSGRNSIKAARPILGDLNERLIETYGVLRAYPGQVIKKLDEMDLKKKKEAYYQLRSEWSTVDDPIYNAALFIYFNKTCYNGLYRVNKDKEFNVPWGGKAREKAKLYDPGNIRKVSDALKECDLLSGDFEHTLSLVKRGYLVYIDPPYHYPGTAGFTDYTSDGFDEKEQSRLAESVYRLNDQGCYVIISNSRTKLVEKLYSEDRGFEIEPVISRRSISCDPNGRQDVTEVLIRNFPRTETKQSILGF